MLSVVHIRSCQHGKIVGVMRFDGGEFIEWETIVVQDVNDHEHISQVMTITYQILKQPESTYFNGSTLVLG